jgi:cation transport ATPase
MGAPPKSGRTNSSSPELAQTQPPLGPVKTDAHADDTEHEHAFEWVELIRIAFVTLAAAAVWFHWWEPFSRVSVIGIAATLIGGYPIFKEAFENIVERKMTMELSMTIALVSALAIGAFFTALVITGFVLAAEVLEGLTVGSRPAGDPKSSRFSPQNRRGPPQWPGRGGPIRSGSSR